MNYEINDEFLNIVNKVDNKIKPKADLELIFQIKKIGVNINQIAKRYNEKKDSNSMDDYLKSLDLLFFYLKIKVFYVIANCTQV